ncbi:MAG TPA: sodium:proton antiporter [Acetobacteraceae bacterium]|nr:sodium:proton antiporter [Acetobacteraceae bacterium]
MRRPIMAAARFAVPFCLAPTTGWTAPTAHGPTGLAFGIPFAGLLLSVALFPMVAPRFWHRRMGMVFAGWIAALLLPLAATAGLVAAAAEAWHAILIEYLPFVTLLLALYVAAGGVLLSGGPWGRPWGNTLLLAIGTALAGVVGTTGVAMVLIHPLLRSNAHRRRKLHLVLFFILLVANAGGATSPLGDPPLYIGFLQGVPFFWPLRHLFAPLVVVAVPLLLAFWLIDRRLAAAEPSPAPPARLHLRGWSNLGLLAVVVGTVLLQGIWHPGDVVLLGQAIGAERLLGIVVFLAIAAISVRTTPRAIRSGNMFAWEPIEEVATLFAAVFITVGPVIAMLHEGLDGPLAALIRLTEDAAGQRLPIVYFWLTGILSAFLDNAPTYLVFFQQAGGDPATLTGPDAHVLEAISTGAVFFGALTYIGNAPNLMVRSVAAHRGVKMPGFFGYMGLAAAALLPCFVLLTLIFFR